MKRIGYEKVFAKMYSDKYHDLLHEVNKLQVYKDILNWMDRVNSEKKT